MIPIKPDSATWTDEQWEAIYKDGTNVIVSAGAGSGKTAVLTERIIEKLKSGISINNLIVLTFTNAAAFEMKNRVRKKIIKEVEKGNTSLKSELDLIDQAIITTFDSFSLSLVKKYHYLLNIDKDISIADNIIISMHKKKIMNEVFTNFYELKDINFLKFIDTFSIKDDIKLQEAILSISSKMDILYNKSDYLDNYLNDFYKEEVINQSIQDYIKILNNYKNNIKLYLEDISYDCKSDIGVSFYEKLCSALEPLFDLNTYDDVSDAVKFIKLPTLPRSKDADELEIEKIKDNYETLKKEFTNLKVLCEYDSELDIFNEIMSTKDTVAIIIDIIKEYDKRLFEFKKSNNLYEFNDIMRLAINILENNDNIRNEYKDNIKEIMIDEYQDTNDIGDYFISLIANNNIYMVGDIKQSIYGFRNANPGIFMSKYDDYKNNINGYKIDLIKNFRSREEVLDGINYIFKRIMDKKLGGADYTDGHEMVFGNLNYSKLGKTKQNNNLEILDYEYKETDYKKKYKQEEIEAFIVASDIKKKIDSHYQVFDKDNNILRDINYSDIAILIDRKTSFDLYKKIFTFLNIPVTIHKDEEFVYSNEIYVINSILRILLSIKDKEYYLEYFDHAFISLARSFVCEYTDDDIFDVFLKAKNDNTYIINVISKHDKFKFLFDKLSYLANYAKNNTLTSLLKEIYKEFDIYNNISKIGNVSSVSIKLDYLLDIVKNLEDLGYNLKDLVDYFNESITTKNDLTFSVGANATNSVNIMTIHKSKGLEYHICYYVGLNKQFSKADLKERYLYNNHYGIVVPVFNEGIKETIYKVLINNLYKENDISEKIRLLYVALTRAKEKMIIVSNLADSDHDYINYNNDIVSDNERLNYKSFYDMLVSIKKDLSYYTSKINLEDINVSKDYELNKNVDYRKLIEKSNEVLSYQSINIEKKVIVQKHFSTRSLETSKEIEHNLEIGIKFHEYLEYLNFKNIEEDFKKYNIDSFYQDRIKKFLNMPFMTNLESASIYKEYEFIYNEKDEYHGIIDLLIEFDDKIIIVDYKLKEINKEAYQEQVNGYINYIKAISNKPVKGYLYSILDSKYIQVLTNI